jgi:spermidine/putrescine transport system permease protein
MSKSNRLAGVSRSVILLWLSVFAAAPLLLIFGLSFLQAGEHVLFHWQLTLSNYSHLIDPLYGKIALQSLRLAFITTFFCLLLGYPMAYFIARLDRRYQGLALLLLIIPFWTSVLIRIYAVMTLLKAKGLINSLLLALGLIHQPLQILYTESAVIFGMIYTLLPFMIMPLYASLEKLDPQVLEAATDLGANGWQRFWRVILPQSWSGLVAGVTLVFLPTMTLFFVPVLLGGARNLLLGNLIETQLLVIHNWPAGAATSVVLSFILLLLMGVYRFFSNRHQGAGR